jgi:hypothetical protein
MKFHESGLPKDPLIEKAFNYSRADLLAREKEELKSYKEHIDGMFSQNLAMMEAVKESGRMSEEQLNEQKKQLDRWRVAQMAAGPEVVVRALTKMFVQHRVAVAKELAQSAGDVSPQLLAVALLADTVRSPIGGQRLEQEFGQGIAAMVFELAHIDAYPSEREDYLTAASNDIKRVFLGKVIISLAGTAREIEETLKRAPSQRAVLNPGQEENIYDDIKPALGADKKLDQRITATFNKLSNLVQSPYKLEINANGSVELVEGLVNNTNLPVPVKKPKNPKNNTNGGIGGNVF